MQNSSAKALKGRLAIAMVTAKKTLMTRCNFDLLDENEFSLGLDDRWNGTDAKAADNPAVCIRHRMIELCREIPALSICHHDSGLWVG